MSKKNSKVPELSEEQRRKIQLIQMKKNDPVVIKQELFKYRQLLVDLQHICITIHRIKKKDSIEQQIQKNQQTNVTQSYQIEQQLKAEQQKCIAYEGQLNQLKTQQQSHIIQLKKKKVQQLQEFQRKKQIQKQEITKQKQILQSKLNYLKQYPQRKIKYEESMHKLKKQLDKMLKSQQKDIGNIKNQHEKTRKKLQADTKQEIEKIKSTEVVRLEKKMTKDQFIKRENQVMQKQITLCQEQKVALEEQCLEMNNTILGQKSKNQYDTALGNQAGQTYQRSLRIIKLQGKLSKLKAYLSEESTKMQKQYEDLDLFYNKQFQQLESKISKNQGWIRMKQRDLKKVKACSQMVLNQRSNLECYLLEVFYEHPQLDYRNQQHINQVLRHLFAKINSKKPPISYKSYLIDSHNSSGSSISKI